MDECIFCRIINKEIPSKIVYEDDFVIAFDDIKPQAPVHVIVIPKKHVKDISELSEEDGVLHTAMMKACVKVAEIKGIKQDGFRLINNCGRNAGQTVFHVHIHVLGGRCFGDTII